MSEGAGKTWSEGVGKTLAETMSALSRLDMEALENLAERAEGLAAQGDVAGWACSERERAELLRRAAELGDFLQASAGNLRVLRGDLTRRGGLWVR